VVTLLVVPAPLPLLELSDPLDVVIGVDELEPVVLPAVVAAVEVVVCAELVATVAVLREASAGS
jgi:hypothetical protein